VCRELFAPLDMTDAVADAHQAERMPPGHEYYVGMVRRAPRTFDTSGVPYGYLAGSVTDLANLTILHTNNGRPVLSEGAVADLHHPGPATAGGHNGPGWRIGTLDSVGARIVWHAGAVTGYHTIVITAAERGWAVVVQQNAWSFLHDASLNAAGFGALTLALGGAPDPPAPRSATLPLLALGTVILALAAGLVAVVRRLALHHPATGRIRPTVLGAAAGIVIGLVSAAGVGLWLPIIILGLALASIAAALLVRTLLPARPELDPSYPSAASWPQAAAISWPRVSRTVQVTPPALTRRTNSRSTGFAEASHCEPGVGLSGITFTCTNWLRCSRRRFPSRSARHGWSLMSRISAYSMDTRRPETPA
jgi:beta-lactamase family protein